jgi:hypothetical protein
MSLKSDMQHSNANGPNDWSNEIFSSFPQHLFRIFLICFMILQNKHVFKIYLKFIYLKNKNKNT